MRYDPPGSQPPEPEEDDLLDLPLGAPSEEVEAPPEQRSEEPISGPRTAERGTAPWLVWLLAALVPAAAFAAWLLKPAPAVIGLEPAFLDFGEVRVGRDAEPLVLELRNLGERALVVGEVRAVGEAAADFRLAGDGCAGRELAEAASCRLRVVFTPGAVGRRTAELEWASNAANARQRLPLAGRGLAPAVRFEPERLHFGSLALGSSSAPLPLELTNAGSATLALGPVQLAGRAAADFFVSEDGCSRRRLEPGESCALRLGFVPTAAGERGAVLRVESDALDGVRELALSGVALREPQLALDRRDVAFGEVLVGSPSAAEIVVVSNRGTAPLELERLEVVAAGTATGDAPGADTGAGSATSSAGGVAFVVAAEGCTRAPLPPDGSCSLSLVFTPTATGEAHALLRLARAGGEPFVLPLAGRGVMPVAFFEPLSLRFGEVPVRSAGALENLRLTNAGSGPLEVAEVAVRGGDAAAFELASESCRGARLRPTEHCELTVRFRPRGDGEQRSELVIGHNGDPGLDRVALFGLGAIGRLGADRRSLDFRGVRATTAEEAALLLTNQGRAALRLRGALIEGADRRAFSLVGRACEGAVLEPGEGCSLSVRFRPETAGRKQARLRLADDSGGAPLEITLAGEALPPPAPEIALEPARLDLGSQEVGGRGPVRTLEVRNPGSAPLVLSEVRLAGAAAADFERAPGSCDRLSSVAPGGRCTVGLRFAPGTEGRREALLILRHNAGVRSSSVELVGYGSVPPPPLPPPGP